MFVCTGYINFIVTFCFLFSIILIANALRTILVTFCVKGSNLIRNHWQVKSFADIFECREKIHLTLGHVECLTVNVEHNYFALPKIPSYSYQKRVALCRASGTFAAGLASIEACYCGGDTFHEHP